MVIKAVKSVRKDEGEETMVGRIYKKLSFESGVEMRWTDA